jgi:hypothetical protein
MKKTVSVILLLGALICFVGVSEGVSVGNLLYRTFLLFAQQPLNAADAQAAGWTNYTNACDPQLGYAYSLEGSSGPSRSYPTALYFSQSGQLSAFGVRAFGQPDPNLIKKGFWKPVNVNGETVYDIAIALRDPSLVCSGRSDPNNVLGDRLKIAGFFNIPLNMLEAEHSGWAMGNCIKQMGIHHAYDLNHPGTNTWNASSLVPVLPMYNSITKAVSAILFWMPDIERVEPFGMWEGPFPGSFFCANWCANTGCHWPGVDFFTTMHWMFTDPSKNTCAQAPCVF